MINITEINGSRANMELSRTIKPFNVNIGANITCKSGTAAFGTVFLAGEETFTAFHTLTHSLVEIINLTVFPKDLSLKFTIVT